MPNERAPDQARLRRLRRVAVAVIGSSVVLVGVAMIVLPGPAIVLIPAGLAILATEFVWARRLLARARERLGARGRPPDVGARER
jgi:tellurite resistance protein TerC